MTFKKTLWPEWKWLLAQGLRAAGNDTLEIARELKMTEAQIANKFSNESGKTAPVARAKERAPALTARDLRHEANSHRTLTSIIMGDPPPGYSALDQKRREGRA